jgi:FkbM family methyltransferase
MILLNRTLSRWIQRYYLGPDHPMKLRLWNGFWIWMNGRLRVQLPYAEGGWIALNVHDWLQFLIFQHGFFEPEVWESLSAKAREGEVVWDVGAHIGSNSIRALLDKRVRAVHSFEPNPVQLDILRVNLALNPGTSTIHPFGLSDRDEVRPLYQGTERDSGLASFEAAPGQECRSASCRTADDLVYREGVEPPTLVKIDVEGWEERVLAGASRLLAENPPKTIVIECASHPDGSLVDHGAADRLMKAGYTFRRIVRPDGSIGPRENYIAEHV